MQTILLFPTAVYYTYTYIHLPNGYMYSKLGSYIIPADPPKWSGSAVCNTIYIHIYPSFRAQTADPNHFGGTAGSSINKKSGKKLRIRTLNFCIIDTE